MVPAITLIEHHSQNDALPISSRTSAQTGASVDGVLLADSPSQRAGSIERPSTARWAFRFAQNAQAATPPATSAIASHHRRHPTGSWSRARCNAVLHVYRAAGREPVGQVVFVIETTFRALS